MKPTPKLAMAAGYDAANDRMRSAGRTTWSDADFALAVETQARLIQMCGNHHEVLAADDALRNNEALKPRRKNDPF